MAMVAPTYHTADMVRALPDDGNRYEVVHGELLVTRGSPGPAPAGPAEVWIPGATFPSAERERVTWHPTGAREAFVLEIEQPFRPV